MVLLFLAGLAIRVSHVTDPWLEFHVARQYRAAVIARGLYLPHNTSMPEWARDIAALNAKQGALEPPIVETLAAYGYRLLGGERLWVGRAVSIVGWLVGAIALYLIARRISSPAGTLVALTVFLFAPFGVLASRSFQPDALMIGITTVAILQIIRLAESRTPQRLSAAILATAIAALIKPMSLFFTLGSFVALHWRAASGRATGNEFWRWPHRLPVGRHAWTFLFLSTLPALAYYAHGLFIAGGLRSEAGGRFLPHLLVTSFFWTGWWTAAQTVVNSWVWGLAGVGALTAATGLPKRLLAGLCSGYVLYSVVFTYHIATHDYYHLPALIVTSLACGIAMTRVEHAVSNHITRRWITLSIIVTVAVAVTVSVRTVRTVLTSYNPAADVATFERIGELVQHSPHTLMLAYDYGLPLAYHGHLTGPVWPAAGDLSAGSVGAGRGAAENSEWSSDIASAEARYREFYEPRKPEYFVITDFESLRSQADLEPFLEKNFRRLVAGNGYRIYDLR